MARQVSATASGGVSAAAGEPAVSAASAPSAEQLASGLAGHDLPPGRAGVEFLDGFIERQRGGLRDGGRCARMRSR
jgi:hypothetical protein